MNQMHQVNIIREANEDDTLLEREQQSIKLNDSSFEASYRVQDERSRRRSIDYINSKGSILGNSGVANMYYKKPEAISNLDFLKDQPIINGGGNSSRGKTGPFSMSMSSRGLGGASTAQNMNNLYLILKDDLIEHFDYEAVSQSVWQYLKAWYGCDY